MIARLRVSWLLAMPGARLRTLPRSPVALIALGIAASVTLLALIAPPPGALKCHPVLGRIGHVCVPAHKP